MAGEIIDGIGQGYRAKVNANNALEVQAVSVDTETAASERGDGYSIDSGLIAYTGTSSSSLLYLKNNEDRDLILTRMYISIGNVTATVTDIPYLTIVRDPTGGDVITDATDAPNHTNRNFGSSKTLTADAYIGKDGGTVTGGDEFLVTQLTAPDRHVFDDDIILPKGSSVGVKINVNTSGGATVHGAMVCYLRDENE